MAGKHIDKFLNIPIENGIHLKSSMGIVHTNVPYLVNPHSQIGYEWGCDSDGAAYLALNMAELFLAHSGYEGKRIACIDGECYEFAWDIHQDLMKEFLLTAYSTETIPYSMIKVWIEHRLEEDAMRLAGKH